MSGTAYAGDLVRLDDSGSNLIVSFGTNFRIDWNGYGAVYYPEGTTIVPIYADRFSIGAPAYGSSTVKTYVFVIRRN